MQIWGVSISNLQYTINVDIRRSSKCIAVKMSLNTTNKHLIHVEGVDQSATVEKKGSIETLIKMCHELINEVNNFFQSTSLHGYAYIINSSSLTIKIMWGVITLGMTCLAFQLLAMNTNEYLRSRITTTIESTTTSLEVKKYIYISFLDWEYFVFIFNFRMLYFHQ